MELPVAIASSKIWISWYFFIEMWQQQLFPPTESDGFHCSPIWTPQITGVPRSATHMDFEVWPNEVSDTCPSVSAAISPLDAPATATCSLNVGARAARVEDQLPSAQLQILSHLHNIWAVMYLCLPKLWPTHVNATLDNAVTNFLNRREIL